MDMSSSPSLSYSGADDRALGAAGMTVAGVVCDADAFILAVNLDAPTPADIIEFSDSFFTAGLWAKSPAAAWQQTLGAYRALVTMAAGNVLARNILGRHKAIPASLRHALRSAVGADGHDTCQLDDDEIDAIFDRTFDYLERVFSHPRVGSLTLALADRLSSARRLARPDFLSILSPLSRL